MVVLTMMRFGAPFTEEFDTVEEAAKVACMCVEYNEAAPARIDDNGCTIWENTGPFDDSYPRLERLAGLQANKT